MKQPGEHSLLGASGAYRWLNCPGSFRLSQQAPPRPSSIYAATGTLAHDLIERELTGSDSDPSPLAEGMVFSVEGHTVTIDPDFLDGIRVMVDYINSRPHDLIAVETIVSLDGYFDPAPPVPMFGRVDVALGQEGAGILEIVDYKNGTGIRVDPRDNPQLLYYAAGMLLGSPPGECHTVDLTVVQPHAPGVEKVRTWRTTSLDVLMWVDDVLVPGVAACDTPDAPLVPGSWCRFCPASHICPRLQQDAVATAQRDFDDSVAGPMPLAEQLEVAERAQVWINAVRDFALEQLQHQMTIPGWGLAPTRPVRRWTDLNEVARTLHGLGFDPQDVMSAELLSPARIEKLVRRKHGNDAWGALVPWIESHSSGVKLARSDTAGDFLDEE